MKSVFLLAFCWLPSLSADFEQHSKALLSDEYQERRKAEQGLIEWARGEKLEERAEILFQRFLTSEDPEEFHRLTKVLLEVHFEQQKTKIPQKGPGFLGIQMSLGDRQDRLQRFDAVRRGVWIEGVIAGTPAEAAGLQAGDLITEIEGDSIAGEFPRQRLQAVVGEKAPGTVLPLKIERAGKVLDVKVTLMNAQAISQAVLGQDEARVDVEKADQLLKEDYVRWLVAQKTSEN